MEVELSSGSFKADDCSGHVCEIELLSENLKEVENGFITISKINIADNHHSEELFFTSPKNNCANTNNIINDSASNLHDANNASITIENNLNHIHQDLLLNNHEENNGIQRKKKIRRKRKAGDHHKSHNNDHHHNDKEGEASSNYYNKKFRKRHFTTSTTGGMQPMAPKNTNEFLMDDHGLPSTPSQSVINSPFRHYVYFDEQSRLYRKDTSLLFPSSSDAASVCPALNERLSLQSSAAFGNDSDSSIGGAGLSTNEEETAYNRSLSDVEDNYLSRDFVKTYENYRFVRLQTLSKDDLVVEHLRLEAKFDKLQKVNGRLVRENDHLKKRLLKFNKDGGQFATELLSSSNNDQE